MRHYELVLVLSPTLSPEETTGAWDRVKELVATASAAITHEEQWGMRRLAYPIRKAGQTFLEGNYLLTRFSTDKRLPQELDTHLRMTESILRYLLVRSEAPPPPKPPPQEAAPVAASDDLEDVEAPVAVAPTEEPAAAEVEEAEPKAEVEEPVVAEVEEPEAEAEVEDPAVAEVEEPEAEAEVEEPAVAEVEEPEAEAEVEEPAVAELENPEDGAEDQEKKP